MAPDEPTWSRVQEVLQAALDEPAETRDQFVRDLCRDDEILFAEVQLVARGARASRPLCRTAGAPPAGRRPPGERRPCRTSRAFKTR